MHLIIRTKIKNADNVANALIIVSNKFDIIITYFVLRFETTTPSISSVGAVSLFIVFAICSTSGGLSLFMNLPNQLFFAAKTESPAIAKINIICLILSIF